jgi:alpha-mannosidase
MNDVGKNKSSAKTDAEAFRRLRGRYPGYTRTRLQQFSRRLRRAIYPERMAAESLAIAGPCDRVTFAQAQALSYRPAKIGEVLGPLWSTYWVRVTARVPEEWRGACVDLWWDSRSEALLWLGGRSSEGLNIGRPAARLLDSAKGGETLTFYIEVACNRAFGAREAGHPHTEPYVLDSCEIRRFDPDAWALFHDFESLRELEADREPKQEPRSFGGVAPRLVRPALDTTWAGKLLHELNRVCNVLDPDDKTTWPEAKDILAGLLSAQNGSVAHELSAIGHAHIDTAWLWPIEETRRKCQRSFANVIALMDRYPDFKFACSQAYQYAVIEETDPDLFARIKEKAKKGQWIPIGGSWVEPDCNLPSGESLARQFLYGQRYFEKHFGRRARIFWNPDVFGYAGQLPQLMREAGMDRFLTQKLSWNRFTAPPHHSFFWRGFDGSEVLTHFPPVDTYNGVCTMDELRYHAANYKDADRTREALYLFGHGDGGGGPDAGMIERLIRAEDLLGVPKSDMRDPNVFFDRLARDADNLATVEGELYFEYHRGTYTSQAETKRLNRLLEGRLQDLEFLSTAAAITGKAHPSREAVEQHWRVLLTNQFHDILPGSSIGEVYKRTTRELAETADAVEALCNDQLRPVGVPLKTMRPVNTTCVARAEVTEIDRAVLFVTAAPFSAGRIVPEKEFEDSPKGVRASAEKNGDIRLENRHLSAVVTRAGSLRSLVHRVSAREMLSADANRFVLFDDRPTEYEAWDIDPFALETGREAEAALTCELFSASALRAEVRVVRAIGQKSKIEQYIRLDAESLHLEFDTIIDWHERKTLLKAMFPLAVKAPRATYETMCGAVERPTHASTDADLAQYEVPGHRWADLSEPAFGVSLLTDASYGYSTFGNVMSLSLLRGPETPDPGADIGTHRIRYALYPHPGDWRQAGTVAQALRFNRPVLWAPPDVDAVLEKPLVETASANVIIDTIKPAEDEDGFVVRLYESHGSATEATFSFGVPIKSAVLSNTLEDRLAPLAVEGNAVRLSLRPFQIATLRVFLPRA